VIPWMSKSKSLSWCLLLALFLAPVISPLSASAAEASPLPSAIERLSQISTRLALLNERLQAELRLCQTNLANLKLQLAASGLELETLTRQLAESKTQIDELARLNQTSQEDLAALRESLAKAQSSLTNLQTSLDAYKRKADAEIKKWRTIAIVVPIIIGGLWVAREITAGRK
jgi:chromosome segregation ATPase